jgi:hypothetical protein
MSDTYNLVGQLERQIRQAQNQEKNKPLKQRIAEAKQAAIVKNAAEVDAAQTRELTDPRHITEGMSTGDKVAAGFQSGLRDVGRNVGNMLGVVSDDSVRKARKLERALRATGAGQVGAFAGETAALLPLSAVGGAARVGNTALRAKNLPAARAALGKALPRASGGAGYRGATGAATAALESGAAGAIMAGPDNRLEGARDAALTGAALNKTVGALSRKFGRGFNENTAAKEFGDAAEELLGYRPKLPVAQSAESRAVAYPHRSILSMFPYARGGSLKMEADATKDFGKAVLVKAFGAKHRDAVLKAVDEADGDLVRAGNELLKTMGRKGFADNKKALRALLNDLKSGEPLTPNAVDRAAKKVAKGEGRPFYKLVSSYAKVMGEPLEESTVSGRRAYNKLLNKFVGASTGAGIAATLGGLPPYVAITAATRAATAAPAQNFMMGRTGANRGITNAAESIYAAALRNAIAADPVE